MFNKILPRLGLILLLSDIAVAGPVATTVSKNMGYRIEPIVGYEQTFRLTPTPHTSNRAIYGLRGAIGPEKLSLEVEFTHAEDTENYVSAPQKITNKDDNLKIGLKYNNALGNNFILSVRAGGEANHNINETTNNGTLTSKDNPYEYHPYAGASVGIKLGKGMDINIGTTMVVKDTSDLTKNNFQNSISFGVGTN